MTHLFLDGSLSQTVVGLTSGPFRLLPSRGASDGLLFTTINQILDEGRLNWHDLSSIAVGSGPGSHTGTRAAAAAAKGLAMGLNLPLKLFPSLLLTLPQASGRIGTSLATRREGKVFVLVYDTQSLDVECNNLLCMHELDILRETLEHFGHDLSPLHLKNFLNKTTPSSMSAPLSYLQL